jgi:glycosyltransferase involved in cell wall biosynthesis
MVGMSSVKFIHIDYGTKGNAGLYLLQILKAYSGPIPVDAYVHSEFPRRLANGHVIRIFDRLSRFIPLKFAQMVYKFFDLHVCFAWLAIVIRLRARKQRLFVFVQFYQSFRAYEWLFRRIKRHCTLIVTVHDAIELGHNYPTLIISPRDDILRHAHFLVVHGSESVQTLNYLSKPIFQILFPLMMDETGFGASSSASEDNSTSVVRFLFIGHFRIEKGLDALINAWRNLPEEILENASLTIAGTYNKDLNIDFNSLINCRLIFDYLNDDQFVELINDCHYVVMPYRGGTNSGVLSVATALNRPCITSRIPLFSNSIFFEEKLSILDLTDLPKLLKTVIMRHPEDYNKYQQNIAAKRIDYKSNFELQINQIYDRLTRKI